MTWSRISQTWILYEKLMLLLFIIFLVSVCNHLSHDEVAKWKQKLIDAIMYNKTFQN